MTKFTPSNFLIFFIVIILVVVLLISHFYIHHSSSQKFFPERKSQNKPEITVIMSTYNRADYLPAAIESILNQTYKNFEFIIINDGSTDTTQKVLESYAKKDDRIILVKNSSNKGLISNLNLGLDMAKGEYIARMDDDDYSLPQRFAIQKEYLDKHPDITVLGTGYFTRETQTYYKGGPEDPKKAKIISYIRVPVLHPTTMFRRTFLNKHSIRYNARYPSSEDTDFFHQIAVKGGKIKNIPAPLLIYTKNSKKIGGYYTQQALSHQDFVEATLSPYMDLKNVVPNHSGFCYILKNLQRSCENKLLDIDLPTIRAVIKANKCQDETYPK